MNKNADTHPCIIKKNTVINGNKCNSDLYLSQDHGILINNLIITAKNMVKPQKPEEDNLDYYLYYHLVTENYFTDVVMSNGIACETYGKIVKDSMGKYLYQYLINNATKNGFRVLLKRSEFNDLMQKFDKIKKRVQLKLMHF